MAADLNGVDRGDRGRLNPRRDGREPLNHRQISGCLLGPLGGGHLGACCRRAGECWGLSRDDGGVLEGLGIDILARGELTSGGGAESKWGGRGGAGRLGGIAPLPLAPLRTEGE